MCTRWQQAKRAHDANQLFSHIFIYHHRIGDGNGLTHTRVFIGQA